LFEKSVCSDSKGIIKHRSCCWIPKCLETNKIDTSNKKPKISTMTHEEEEEMQHDISKLQDQAQQISLS